MNFFKLKNLKLNVFSNKLLILVQLDSALKDAVFCKY